MNILLKLSREVLEKYFEEKEPEVSKEIVKSFSAKQSCFVTLTKNGKLRGCIGSLYPKQELYKEIIENAVSAAFHDPRFSPLKKEELSAVKIEISVLTIPEKLEFEDSEDLLNKLTKKEGVLIEKGFASATYLPQVWGDIQNKREFLSSLCEKAGLPQDSWKKPGMKVSVYHVQIIRE